VAIKRQLPGRHGVRFGRADNGLEDGQAYRSGAAVGDSAELTTVYKMVKLIVLVLLLVVL
jgi:hypothetical protein